MTVETEATEVTEATTSTTTADADKVDLGLGGDDVKTEEKTEEKAETKTEEKVEAKADETVDARYGAPEEGTAYDIKLEGDVTIDADALALVDPELRALNLSNEAATKLIGTFAEKVLPHYEAQFTKNLEASILANRTEWEGAARDLIKGKTEAGEELVAKNAAGDVLSFDGNELKGVQAIAAKALDRIAPAGFREFLNETGLGVHPQMIAFTYQVGKALAEDQDFDTGTTSKVALTREQKYYPEKS